MTSRAAATLRAVPTLLRVGFADVVAYRAQMVIWLLAYTTPLIMLALWTAVAHDAPIGGFDARAFQAYFLLTLVVRVSTGSWVVWEMNFEIRNGLLARRLLRPVHPLAAYACENLSALPMRMLLVLPIFLATIAWLGSGILVEDPVQRAIVPLSMLGAWAVMFSAMVVIGATGLWWESALGLFDAWLGLHFVFSGYVVPLELYPERLRAVLDWLPFKYTLSFPVSNLLGRLSREEALHALAAQWAWAAILCCAAILIWERGVKRFEAYGG